MKDIILLLLCTVVSFASISQNKIKGKVIDVTTKKPLNGAHIISENKKTTTDEIGKFEIACNSSVSIKISFIGYTTSEQKVNCGEEIFIELKPENINLNEVDIKAVNQEQQEILKAPQSIAKLSEEQLHRNSGLYLEEALNLEPGIRMEKRTNAGGQRITIRGYGNNTNFNGLGYKLYYDGVPITDAEGTTIMDALDFSNLGSVTVYKGPSSSIYGTGIAGTVNLHSIKPKLNETSISQEVIGGSYGLFRTNTAVSTATDKSALRLNYGHQSFDGYRTHTGSKKNFVSIFGSYQPNKKQYFETTFNYANSYELLAGQLDSADFFSRRNVAEASYIGNDGHVEIENIRASLSHTYRFNKNISNTTRAFFSGNTLNQTFAAGLNDDYTLSFGGRSFFDFSFFMDKKVKLNGKLGGEYLKSTAKKSSSAMFGGILGDFRSQNNIYSQQYFVFTEWQLILPFDIEINAGLSVNFNEYKIEDLLANSSNPTHKDGSGYKKFKPIITPRASIQKTWKDQYTVYFSYSKGYIAPTSSDAVISYTGTVNNNLLPELGTQYELGTKGKVLNGKLNYQVALFYLQIDNKLNSRAVADTSGVILYSYTVNSGNQANMGAEAGLSYAIIQDKEKTVSLLRPFINFTYSNFKYTDFKSDANDNVNTTDYTGKSVIGVPPVLLNGGFDLGFKFGLYVNANVQYVDKMAVTYNNKHFAPSFTLVNGKIGYRKSWEHFELNAFFGVNNITNSLYYNMVFVNWEKGPQPSIYSPAAHNPTCYGGFSLKYKF